MKFWDSSAILPLLVVKRATVAVRAIARKDGDMAVWWATRIECRSAVARREREGILGADAARRLGEEIDLLAVAWSEILPTEAVRQRAERHLSVHRLRSADALQLAAALVWAEDGPRGLEFVCLDGQLRTAALSEGFTVLPARLPLGAS